VATHSTKSKHRDLTEYRKTPIYIKLKEARLRNNKKLFGSLMREEISLDFF